MAKTLHDGLNKQLNQELQASYLYLSMAAHFEAVNFPGFAKWMRAQSDEEREHAMKFWDFIYSTNGQVELLPLDQPPTKFSSPLDAFEKALESEQENTREIHKLYDSAQSSKDYPAQVFLNWFVEEQVEEEDMAGRIVDQLKIVGDSTSALLMMDRELGSRGEGGPV